MPKITTISGVFGWEVDAAGKYGVRAFASFIVTPDGAREDESAVQKVATRGTFGIPRVGNQEYCEGIEQGEKARLLEILAALGIPAPTEWVRTCNARQEGGEVVGSGEAWLFMMAQLLQEPTSF